MQSFSTDKDMGDMKEERSTVHSWRTHSEKASDIIRQLCFAGIAVIWVFRTSDNGRTIVPWHLMQACLPLVAALGVDLLHYSIAALMAAFKHGKCETFDEVDELFVGAFVFKLILTVIGYGFILWFLGNNLFTRVR